MVEQGIVGPAQLGTAGYLYETPEQRMLTAYWNMIWEGRIPEAIEDAQETGLDRLSEEIGGGSRTIRDGPTTSPTGAKGSATRRR